MQDHNDVLPAAPRRRIGWPLVVVLALAFVAAIGVGTVIGLNISAAHAANSPSTFSPNAGPFQGLAGNPYNSQAGGTGAQGQCDAYSVTSVNGATIVAKAADGTSVTIHTSSGTKYTQNGQTAIASAVTTGARIHVTGTHNSDGSITATQIDVG